MDAYLKVFIVAAAVAVMLQFGILLLAYLRWAKLDAETKELRRQLREQAGPILHNVEEISHTVRENSRLILGDLSALTHDARRQMDKFDRLTDEFADRLRLQIVRVDELLTQTLETLEKAGSTVRENVVGPVREATAILQGVRAVIDFLSARRNRSRRVPRRVDEELFI